MAAQGPVDFFSSIPDGPLSGILLGLDRLPASAVVSRRWRGIASDDKFLKDFRKRHPSSPLLGVFASDPQGRVPLFYNVSDDPDLKAVVSNADTALAYLGMDWCIQDCRNGRLLLSNDENELCIYDPLSQLRVHIPKRDDTAGKYVSDCLLEGDGTSSLRVVSVFRRGKSAEAAVSYRVLSVQRSGRNVRAVECDPSMPEWRVHRWEWVTPLVNDHRAMPRWDCGAMYAAGHIFWRYGAGSLFMLDTTTMKFKTLHLPWKLTFHHHLRYAIGEIEDSKGCLVCLQVPDAFSDMPTSRLQVWLLEKKEAGICWEFKKEVSLNKLLGADASVWKVPTVINGLALISKQECSNQYVVDLQSMTRLADVKFRGKGYLYQMPWPPAGLAAATSAGSAPPRKETCIDKLFSTSVGSRSSHDGVDLVVHEESDGDEHNKLSSSGRIKEPPTLSCLEPSCFQSQYVDSPDVDGGSGDEAAPLENHHVLKSTSKHHDEQFTSKWQTAANIEDHLNEYNKYESQVNHQSKADNMADKEPGGQRNKQKANTTSTVISSNKSETRLGHLDEQIPSPSSCNPRVVESETSSTSAVPQNNLRVPRGKISVGQKATTQHARANNEKFSLHVEDGTGKYKCNFEGCPSTFSVRSSLNRHFREVHGQGECIPCTQCDRKFKRTDHFNNHVEKIHKSRETPLMCQFEGCNAKFLEKHKRKTHEKSSVHFELDTLGAGKFKCHFKGCLSTFSTREYHNRHYRKFHLKTSAFGGEPGRPRKEKT